MPNAPYPISECFPEIWVERGGAALAALLSALDESWTSATTEWSRQPSLDTAAVLDVLSAATGWGSLLDEIGGAERVRHQARLANLLGAAFRGAPIRIGDWLFCLFGLNVHSCEMRGPEGHLPNQMPAMLRLKVSGPGLKDPAMLLRVLRRLTPAHVSVAEDSVSWLKEVEGS